MKTFWKMMWVVALVALAVESWGAAKVGPVYYTPFSYAWLSNATSGATALSELGAVANAAGTATNLTVAGGQLTAALTNTLASTNRLAIFNGTKELTNAPGVLDEIWAWRTGTSGIPNDGLSDDLALTNMLASSEISRVHFTKGTWNFSTNITTAATVGIVIDPGALLKPATNITLKFGGPFDAPNTKIFDFTAGGHVSFPTLAAGTPQARVVRIRPLWFGLGNGNGSADTTPWTELFASVSGVSSVIEFTPGQYALGVQVTVPSRCVLRGMENRNAVTINSSVPTAGASAFLVPTGAQDVVIENIVLNQAYTTYPNAYTNQFAIRVNPDQDRLIIRRCTFQGFQGGGIYIDGGAFAEGVLYSELTDNLFINLRNGTNYGGNGLRLAYGILATNTFTTAIIRNNKYRGVDQDIWFHQGPVNQIGSIRWEDETLEGAGQNGLTATNAVAFEMTGDLAASNFYFERAQVQDVIYVSNGGGTNKVATSQVFTAGTINGDYGGSVLSVNGITVNGVARPTIVGTRFNNIVSNYVQALNATAVVMVNPYFDLGGSNETTLVNIRSRLVGPVTLERGPEVYTNTYAATVTLNPYNQRVQSLTLAGDVTLATTSLAAGQSVDLKVASDGSVRTFTLPAGWVNLGTALTTMAANKTGVLRIWSLGTTDASVVYSWAVQP